MEFRTAGRRLLHEPRPFRHVQRGGILETAVQAQNGRADHSGRVFFARPLRRGGGGQTRNRRAAPASKHPSTNTCTDEGEETVAS
eukprot:2460794-Alexandrium_andersonii.AAC.1